MGCGDRRDDGQAQAESFGRSGTVGGEAPEGLGEQRDFPLVGTGPRSRRPRAAYAGRRTRSDVSQPPGSLYRTALSTTLAAMRPSSVPSPATRASPSSAPPQCLACRAGSWAARPRSTPVRPARRSSGRSGHRVGRGRGRGSPPRAGRPCRGPPCGPCQRSRPTSSDSGSGPSGGDVDRGAHHREGCPQLVGDVGHEAPLGLESLLQPAEKVIDRVAQLL